MKKALLLLAAFLMVNVTFARTADLFSYDKAQVQKALVNADALDHYVSQAMVSMDKIDLGTPVTSNFKAESDNNLMDEPALGIGGFWWGLIIGPLGILIVYLVTEDEEETKKALYGCLVLGAAYGLCYLAYWAFFIAAWTSAASDVGGY